MVRLFLQIGDRHPSIVLWPEGKFESPQEMWQSKSRRSPLFTVSLICIVDSLAGVSLVIMLLIIWTMPGTNSRVLFSQTWKD